jgi:PTS system cellobiose-specific IIB component
MKKILLCCAAGMSTSLLVSKMEQAAKEQNIESKIWAVSIEDLSNNLKLGVNVVLLGPQIRYKLNEVKKICDEKNIPVEVINMIDYGSMNGKNVLKFAFDLIK